MVAFKFPNPLAGPFKPGMTPSPSPKQYAPVFDSDSDDECAMPPALNQPHSPQYPPVFDSDSDSDECVTPPAPNQPESLQYPPTFDSDDEYETEDDGESICSVVSEISFRRRPIPVAPKKRVSLIAVVLDAIRKDNIGFDDDEWEDSDWPSDGSSDYEPLNGVSYAVDDMAAGRLFVRDPIENRIVDSQQQQETEHADSDAIAPVETQAPRKKGLFSKTMTGIKWCGSSIARLCTKPKGKQDPAAPAAANAQAEDDEEVDPCEMFFGADYAEMVQN